MKKEFVMELVLKAKLEGVITNHHVIKFDAVNIGLTEAGMHKFAAWLVVNGHDIDHALGIAGRVRMSPYQGDRLWVGIKNSTRIAERCCTICGKTTSWCNKYRRTKKSIETEESDTNRHKAIVQRLVKKMSPSKSNTVDVTLDFKRAIDLNT